MGTAHACLVTSGRCAPGRDGAVVPRASSRMLGGPSVKVRVWDPNASAYVRPNPEELALPEENAGLVAQRRRHARGRTGRSNARPAPLRRHGQATSAFQDAQSP